ncbi:NUDIX domain-containing protein [Streptomyces sp. NPDC059340]|uniref:NUDIX domain-containing protein n=1 Tax=Streptomyces sp. NPDC059340 TaxID=3346806 RepID=UPI00367E5CDB
MTNRKKVSVGGISFDDKGRILLVNPSYKERWDLPGGILEVGEDPVTGLRREIREELGIECRVGELRAVDYGASDWEGAEIIMLTFFVELAARTPQDFDFTDGEITEVAFHDPVEALALVTPRMSDRLRVALRMASGGEHGILVRRPLDPLADVWESAHR